MRIRSILTTVFVTLSLTLFSAGALRTQASTPSGKVAASAAKPATSEEDLDATREQLFRLLRISPKLTMVVARDPSLLADEGYVSRNNPELAQFLQTHPEVVRNPEFYLFANLMDGRGRSREFRLERQVWPEFNQGDFGREQANLGGFAAFVVFLCILSSLLWLIRVLLENRRWTKVFHQQNEAHNKLLEKFGSSEDVLAYMRSDSGKKLLEFSAIPTGLGSGLGWSNPIARVVTPLQFGIVLTLVGLGFFILKSKGDIQGPPLFMFGVLTLAVGLGLIISAGLSWAFARHLGMLPAKDAQSSASDGLTESR